MARHDYRADTSISPDAAAEDYRYLIVAVGGPVCERKPGHPPTYLRFNTESLATRTLYDVQKVLPDARVVELGPEREFKPGVGHRAVGGRCPMGCGETLRLDSYGEVFCDSGDCPRPGAAHELLSLPTDHVAYIDAHHFTIEHPARERIEGTMHTCEFNRVLQKLDGPPVENGRYRMVRREGDPVSHSARSDDIGYDFIPLDKEAR